MVLQKLSQSIKVSLALMVAVFSSGLLQPAVAYAAQPAEVGDTTASRGQETCPHDFDAELGGWLKYDGLNSTTFSVPEKDGFTVTNICYKASTSVVYPGVSTTVTSTVTNSNGQVQNLSHVSVYYTPVVAEDETGTLSVSSTCEAITLGSSMISPADGTVTYEIDDAIASEGVNPATAGTHTVELLVNGVVVDTATIEVAACQDEEEVTPAGALTVDTSCEAGSFSGIVTAPIDGVPTYTINGSPASPGDYTNVLPGEYTVTMFVNGVEVDSKTVTIEACTEPDTERVTLCHATGSEKNPFVRITVDAAGAYNGHLGSDHQNGEDIIPTFTYNGNTYSQNWTEGDTLPENCNEARPVTPAAVQFLNPTCENPSGRVTVTPTEGVTYKVGDTVITGTTTYPAGSTVTVTAYPSDESYVLDEEAQTSWSYTFTAAPTGCVLGENDVCPNIEGTQTSVPAGYAQNPMTGECFTPGRGAGTPETQGTSQTTTTPGKTLGASTTLPATIPATGGSSNPFMILAAALLAYGATYFIQGRRLIGRKESIQV